MPFLPTLKIGFLHIPKTAGTSVKVLLQRQEVPIEFLEGLSRSERKKVESSLSTASLSTASSRKHFTFRELRTVAKQSFEDYNFFAFVRNPWERLASNFFWGRKQTFKCFLPEALENFDFYVDIVCEILPTFPSWYDNHWRAQVDFIKDCPNLHLGRLENFKVDLQRFSQQLGLRYTNPPHRNKSKQQKIDYRDLYSKRSRDKIAKLYAEDIETFNYTFD